MNAIIARKLKEIAKSSISKVFRRVNLKIESSLTYSISVVNVLDFHIDRRFLLPVLGFALLTASCENPFQAQKQPEHPIVVVGIDGGEWNVILPMIAKGQLPNFKQLIDKGVSGELINPGPAISPPVWTTFATGHFPRSHGILDHVHPFDDSKGKIPIDSTYRLKPTLWNLATHYDLKTAVIGYFVSWPAETINGTLISDKAWQGLPNSITPAEIESDYSEAFSGFNNQSNWQQVLQRYFPWGYSREQALDASDPNHLASSQIAYRVDNLLAKDEAHRQIVKTIPIDGVDLFIAYYRAPDITSHSFWKYFESESYDHPPSNELKEKLGNAIPESYRFVDQAIGELFERFGESANYIVISDHGFRPVPEQTIDTGHHKWELTGNHRLTGIFIAAGPDIESGEVEMITTMDVMPTISYLLCLPISDELPGSVRFNLIRREFDERCPMTSVDSYSHVQMNTVAASEDVKASQSTMQELRGLGYVGEDVETAYPQNDQQYDFWTSSERLIVDHISGELVYNLIEGNALETTRILEELRLRRPDLEKKIKDYSNSALNQLGHNTGENKRSLEIL